MAAGASSAVPSEPTGRVVVALDDPVRDSSLTIALPATARTLGELLESYRSADLRALAGAGHVDPERLLDLERFADTLFLLEDGGALGAIDPGLRFTVDGRPCPLDRPVLDDRPEGRPIRVAVDRSGARYSRNWPAFLARRWRLRADAYAGFVESVVADACGRAAEAVLRLDTPERVRRFLEAVGGRIHAAPYETYSRYLEPCSPFKSCDQALVRIIEGDGGICAEKAMALYLIAAAYGIPAELVLGGDEASGSFPYGTLRSLLDRDAFDFAGTGEAQRHWQHYAVLCRTPGPDGDDGEYGVFCDVADSNIPFLCRDLREVRSLLDPRRRRALEVTVTLEPIRLYYHRLARRQDLPLDLCYAMEHLIDGIDIVQTVDNELGLLHAGDLWVGAVASRGPRERRRIADEYARYVSRAGLDPRADLCLAPDLTAARHPLADRLHADHSRAASRLVAADPGLRRRLDVVAPGCALDYVILRLKGG